MTTYKRRQTDTIEATQFTSDLGGIVRGVTPGSVATGFEYSEHSGYSFYGQRVSFGDYLVGSMVIERQAFEKLWELDVPAIPPPLDGLADAPTSEDPIDDRTLVDRSIATRSTTGSVAVDTVLKQKAAAHRDQEVHPRKPRYDDAQPRKHGKGTERGE